MLNIVAFVTDEFRQPTFIKFDDDTHDQYREDLSINRKENGGLDIH